MRRLVSYLVAAVAALALASCSPETPSARFECTCTATAVSVDNSRFYTLCESDGDAVNGDAVRQCELEFGDDAGCECECTHRGDC